VISTNFQFASTSVQADTVRTFDRQPVLPVGGSNIAPISTPQQQLQHAPTESFRNSGLGSLISHHLAATAPSDISTVSTSLGDISCRIPPLPNAASGYLCPICSKPQRRITREREWRYVVSCRISHTVLTLTLACYRTHVFADLTPYMCILPDCDTGEHCYAAKEQWIEHQNWHRNSTDEISVHTVCPFCAVTADKTWTDQKWYMHVLRHMERIRLLALPTSGLISGDNDDLVSFDSTASGVSDDLPSQSSPSGGSSEFRACLKGVQLTRYDYATNRWLHEIPDEEGGAPPKSVHTSTYNIIR